MNGTSGVRLRIGKSEDLPTPETNEPKSEREDHLPPVSSLRMAPPHFAFIVFAVYAFMLWIQDSLDSYQFPKALTYEDIPDHPGEFISQRAMDRLVKLTDIGPRVAGSYENEVLAVNVLTEDIKKIISEANPIHKIELDIKKYSGSFPLKFLDGLTNVYKNVQNVMVKFGSHNDSQHSILINCHFDSVPDSPGGSDDGAGCAVMIEILETLSKDNVSLTHNIIFLFNGAEENLMHGSHGFITQHPWAKEVRAFINIEACGAGGREVLFQSGPQSPWIMKVYANTVKYPFASSLAQEVFESGIIPGDTDFRVFRDFGNVSGLDFAWSTNGYVYHTKFDNVDQIPLETLQRTGENILALAKGMANAEELKNVKKYKSGNMIYFDILGLYLVRWPEYVGVIINVSTAILSLWLLKLDTKDAKKEGIDFHSYWRYGGKILAINLGSTFCSMLAILSISGFISLAGRSMSWYSRPVWLVFLYVIPTVTTTMFFQYYLTQIYLRGIKSRMLLFQMYYNVYLTSWTFGMMVLTLLRIRSGYIAWMWVISPVLVKIIHRMAGKSYPNNPNFKWLCFVLGSVFFPAIQHVNMLAGCFALFIPIMGRSGLLINSEVVMALFSNVSCGLLFTYVAPIILVIDNPKKVFNMMGFIFPTALLLLFLTPLGFPYNGDMSAPKPQRYMILHTHRSFHNRHGIEIGSESGYWLVDHDYNSPQKAVPYVPELSYAIMVDRECDKHLYCGFPYLMPVLSFIKKTHWIVSNPPKTDINTIVNVRARTRLNNGIERVNIDIDGPDHMGLIISPKPGVTFYRWSLNDDQPVKGPKWNGQETYFVYYASSSGPQTWEFYVDFKAPKCNGSVMDFAVISHYLHGRRKNDLPFKRMLAQFPSWTAVTSWTATYKSYVV